MSQRKTAFPSMLGLGLIACFALPAAGWAGEGTGAAPGQFFNLAAYKLQTPVAKGDSVQEIAQPALRDFSSPYFYYDPTAKAMVFLCPDNGASTRGSHFPRSELRDTRDWTFTGHHSLSASLAVTQQPSTGSLIVGQIHGNGKGSEALKIRWSRGDLVVGIKTSPGSTEQRFTLVHGLKLGDRIDYRIAQQDKVVTVTINGVAQSFTYDPSWNGESVYFKAGNYLQDNSASGSVGAVRFYALSSD